VSAGRGTGPTLESLYVQLAGKVAARNLARQRGRADQEALAVAGIDGLLDAVLVLRRLDTRIPSS
jgi:hypothetical protein